MRFDLSDGSIPLLTSKKMFTRGMIEEIFWYFRGETNIQPLLDANVHIWDEWADENGDLGPVYGAMWRAWPDTQLVVGNDKKKEYEDRGYEMLVHGGGNFFVMHKDIDQLGEAIELLKTSPDSRRIIVNSWNPGLLPVDLKVPKNNPKLGLQALPPCHCMFQFTVADGKLNCDLRQRSADIGLGVPFNIAQYSIITHLIAKLVGLQPGEFVWNGVDCHIYSNHVDKLKEQCTRGYTESPTLQLADSILGKDPRDITADEIKVVGYDNPREKINLQVAT
ncbi:Thymidylate synthase [compost metagenome]